MDPQLPGDSLVDALVQRLRDRVAERRSNGSYPPGLEDELDAHFRRITAFRQQARGSFRDRIEAISDTIAVAPVPTTSRVPGGRLVHKVIRRLIDRHLQNIRLQFEIQGTAVQSALESLVDPLENVMSERAVGVARRADDMESRLADLERALNALRADILTVIERRLHDTPSSGPAAARFEPWYSNDDFEASFRGGHKEMLERYRDLAARFEGCSPVVDIGFGRGELLELLEELGVDASGVEVDPVLVKEAAERGFVVRHDDGISYLAGLEDEALGGLSLIQVIEHVSPQEVLDLVALAHRKLRPGGKAIIETVNPQSLYVFAHSFYLDPTHLRPVHPGYLAFLFREAGFAEVVIDWRNPPEDDALREIPGGDDATRVLNENVERLNKLLFAPQDFALIATR